MTRPIKFRAWDNVDKRIRGWDELKNHLDTLFDYAALMQFTGLLDKNGKEIYEGDVLETNGEEKLEVYWNSMFARFRFGNQATHDYDIATRMKIIGNIYENPSLLSA